MTGGEGEVRMHKHVCGEKNRLYRSTNKMFSSTWMDTEIVVLNEVNREAGTLYDAPYRKNLKRHDTDELIYKTETDSQRSYLWLPGRKDEGKG